MPLDPGDIGRVINMNITETLTDINVKTGQVEPHLATGWEQIDDLTWRSRCAEGVSFQDGAPFNADAVVTSINRLMNPKLTCDSRSKFGDVTLTPTAVDAFTLDVTSDIPMPIMPTSWARCRSFRPTCRSIRGSTRPWAPVPTPWLRPMPSTSC